MSRGQRLRALVSERLTAAAEEIFALVEKTILEYEEELSRSKEENQRKQQLLDQVLIPEEVPAPSIDVQIQTERRSDAALCKQEEDMVCSLLKKEASGLRRPMETEVYILDPDPDPDPLLPENPETVVTETAKECPVGKRKRGRPRRVPVPADAVEKRQQRSGEGRVEKKRVGRGAAPVHPAPASPPPEPLMEDVLLPKDSHKPLYKNFQIKREQREAAGSDAEGSEREERLPEFTSVFEPSNDRSERREDTDCEDWSYDWQAQPGGSQQLLDSDDEPDDYNLDDDALLDVTGKKAASKSGKSDVDDKVKHECPVCRKKLGRKQELKRHMLLHTGEKPFSCPVCHKRFIQKSNLKSHIVTHLDSVDTIIRFQKPLDSHGDAEGEDWGADGELKLSDQDSEHEEDWPALEPGVSGSSQRLDAADEVQDASLERISLLLHQALNESKARGKPSEFQCPMCDKIFGRMENLRRHLLVHTGEKAFSCPVCHKQFTLKQHLKLHMVLHTRDQQFSCSICAKTFIRKDNLRSHMRIHSTDRPFGCSHCGARFYTDQDLARHVAHHMGQRNFVCPVCNSGFLSRRYLNRHIKIHQREPQDLLSTPVNTPDTSTTPLNRHVQIHQREPQDLLLGVTEPGNEPQPGRNLSIVQQHT